MFLVRFQDNVNRVTKNPKALKFIDLIFVLILITLPFYFRLAFVMAMFWRSLRDEFNSSEDNFAGPKGNREGKSKYVSPPSS